MAKGTKAKENITNIIINALGSSFITISDKKIYTWAEDEKGEKVQIAITMTMPKVPIAAGAPTNVSTDWSEGSESAGANVQITPVELSPEDKAKVQELMERLGVK